MGRVLYRLIARTAICVTLVRQARHDRRPAHAADVTQVSLDNHGTPLGCRPSAVRSGGPSQSPVIARCMIWGVGCDSRSYASSTSAFVYNLLHCVQVLCDSALSRVTLG